MRNYYEILGVEQSATAEEIRSRYIFLVKVYHPDRFNDLESKARAEEDLKQINLAYEVLSNPEKRQDYDAQINSNKYDDAQRATNHKEDEFSQKQFDLMVAYLQEVTKRWHHILDPLPDIASTKVPFDAFIQLVVGLLFKLLPDINSSQKDDLIDEIANKVIRVISLNIMLGAQYEQFGYQDQIDPALLQYLTFFQVIKQLQDILKKGQIENRITERESTQFVEDITDKISIICHLSEGVGRSIVQKQKQAGQSARNTSNNENSKQSEDRSYDKKKPGAEATGYCQSCFANVPTEKVTFRQSIGAIAVRFTKKIEGELCADCIEKNFWEMTGKTFLLGWFSVISFITTPFILVGNIANYLKTKNLRHSSSNLSSIAVGWKFIIFLVTVAIAFAVFSLGSGNRTNATTQIVPVPTQVNNTVAMTRTTSPTKRPTQVNYVYKTSTPETCLLWSKVTKNDKGKKLCVYGTVKKAYWGEDIFYITFGDGIYDFRMLVLNGYYYKDIQGKCVRVEGIVKTYQDLPYIEVNDNLLKCP